MNIRFRGPPSSDYRFVRAAAAALLIGGASAPPPAQAQATDTPRVALVEQLDAQYAETQAAIGVTEDGGIVEIFTSNDDATWTLLWTRPDGTSRIIAAGQTRLER